MVMLRKGTIIAFHSTEAVLGLGPLMVGQIIERIIYIYSLHKASLIYFLEWTLSGDDGGGTLLGLHLERASGEDQASTLVPPQSLSTRPISRDSIIHVEYCIVTT